MRTAIIDLGTNTFNLLIRGKRGKVYYNDKIPVKLGKGGFKMGVITPEAFERGLDALQRFLKICDKQKVAQVYAFATSAVRSSQNGLEFVEAVKEKLNLRINVIDGDSEASLIYQGVKNAMSFDGKVVLIMDVGGGSTEFIIGTQNEILWKKSYPLGVARLLEKFNPHEPLATTDFSEINAYFEDLLGDLFSAVYRYKPERLIGSSGSFETLHDICALRFGHQTVLPEQTYSQIFLHEFNQVNKLLAKSTLMERMVMPGMLSMRADTLHLSALQISFILEKTGILEMFVSMYALKEGVIYALQNPEEKWLKS